MPLSHRVFHKTTAERKKKTAPLAFFRAWPPSARLSARHTPRSASGSWRAPFAGDSAYATLEESQKSAHENEKANFHQQDHLSRHLRWGINTDISAALDVRESEGEIMPPPQLNIMVVGGKKKCIFCDTSAGSKTEETKSRPNVFISNRHKK